MKKTIQTISAIMAVLVLAAFAPAEITKMEVKSSSINWKGEKVTGQHTGTINLKSGYLEMDGKTVSGGMFVVDMTSLTVTDLKAGSGKEKLEGHLNSDDFFGVANYPTATLKINKGTVSGNTHSLSGDITIKGVTQPVSFDLVMDGSTGTAKVVIDRTKFGIRYGSGSFFDNLGDKAIYDDFELDITLNF